MITSAAGGAGCRPRRRQRGWRLFLCAMEPGRCFRLQLCEDGEEHFVVRLLVYVVHIDVADDALLVYDEDGALGVSSGRNTRTSERPHRAGRSRSERIRNAPKLSAHALRQSGAVHAEAQNLGLDPIEPGQLGLVGRDLVRSDRCPGKRKNTSATFRLPK